MSVVAAALRELIALGVSGDALIAAVERIEQAAVVERAATVAEAVEIATRAADADLSKRQARNARYYDARKRLKSSESKTIKTVSDASDAIKTVSDGAALAPVRVVKPTSSLRSEDTQEAKASFVNASSVEATEAPPEKPKTKPPKAVRGTRLPEDWEPSAEEIDLAREAGLTDEEIRRAALEFRNYWCSRSRDATKLSWRLTWHNRCLEIAERNRRASARMAASPGQPGGGRRGSASFADIFVARHGLSSG